MKKKRIIYIVKILIGLSIVIIFVLIYNYFFSAKPMIKVAESFIENRYSNVDYNNIEEKCSIQKKLLDKSLINSNFKFGDFEKHIDEIIKNKICTKLMDKQIYYIKKNGNIARLKIRFTVFYSSNKDTEWYQTTYYDLQMTIKKESLLKYKIDYIKILKESIEVSDTNTESHEHQ